MTLSEKSDVELAGELEAIARAAAERLRARTGGDAERGVELGRAVGEAASCAIAAGLSLAEIADAERIGERRTREELRAEVLRRVERAARRKREAHSEYEQAVVRAGRLGLARRDVAGAAGVAHGTVRAILARSQTSLAQPGTASAAVAVTEAGSEVQAADGAGLVAAGAAPAQGAAEGL